MATGTIKYTGTLTVTSCWCGIRLAIPDDLHSLARRHKDQVVFCPLGHKFIYGNTVEEQLEETKQRLAQERRTSAARLDLLHAEERSHIATRGHVTRKKKQLDRVKAGVCPCCNRTFKDLARHMESKHPDFQS